MGRVTSFWRRKVVTGAHHVNVLQPTEWYTLKYLNFFLVVKFYVIYILPKAFLKERKRKHRRKASGRRKGRQHQARCRSQRSTRFPQGDLGNRGPREPQKHPRVELVLDHSRAGKLKAGHDRVSPNVAGSIPPPAGG